MVPIKYRIAHSNGKFYYWGFIQRGGHMIFVSPPQFVEENCSAHEYVQQHSERLLGYDEFGNEVYKNDRVRHKNTQAGYIEAIFTVDDDYPPSGSMVDYIKTGNIHNIQEELKQ